jgi:hypothetical protein
MKKKVLFTLMFLFVVVMVGHRQADAREPVKLKVGREGARARLLEGTGKVLSQGDKEWRSLRSTDVLKAGDEIFTGPKSRLEVAMPDGSKVRFAEKTRFILQRAEFGDEKLGRNVRVHVMIGRTWANVVKSVTGKSVFELSCNNAVAGVRGTIYRINVDEDKSALVKVYEGTVEVTIWTGRPTGQSLSSGLPEKVAGPKPVPGPKKISMEEWTYLIKSMQQIRIRGDGTAERPQDFDAREDLDDWVRWNKSRDDNRVNDVEDDT